jgi:phosphoribosylformylglycinamidine synthase subunit PurSL
MSRCSTVGNSTSEIFADCPLPGIAAIAKIFQMIYRIDVRTRPSARGGQSSTDPLGASLRHQIQEFGHETGAIETARIFLLDTDASAEQIQRAAKTLLSDPIVESAEVLQEVPADTQHARIEIHLKPGVMDPVAASTEMALRDMGLSVREVRTGRSYLLANKLSKQDLKHIAARVLANGVIESVHTEAHIPASFSAPKETHFHIRHVPLRELTDEQLSKLSREAHLFLSLPEMQAIQSHFRGQNREPTDIELETLAQTWSEHCVHKTLKSAVDVEVRDIDNNLIATRRYKNLIKETIFQSTQQLIEHRRSITNHQSRDFCLSVFKDNAGVIAFDETDAVCFKVETHNHPSAIEPYGGAATGSGGCIRDVMGTGLSAKPIANTDIFCVAYPESEPDPLSGKRGSGSLSPHSTPGTQHSALPRGVIHPKRILQQVVAGVRDYGNRMGIPTVNGAVYFDDNYLANPLVFCGCVGLIPRNKIQKQSHIGDAIIVMGGRTGRDGIHGATFSSAELTDTHADEFSHAVQIGNAITQKKMMDVILKARDLDLFTAITDCGAGGLSSAIGEMGEKLGAEVHLDKVPLKYPGLRYDEIWISEAQERMVLSVPRAHVPTLLSLAKSEDVEATVIGHFGTADHTLRLFYKEKQVATLSMDFMHNGIPMPTRRAVIRTPGSGFSGQGSEKTTGTGTVSLSRKTDGIMVNNADKTGTGTVFFPNSESRPLTTLLLKLLAHPNIASKHWIIRQYDHEVQGGSVVKPLTGPLQMGPSDASVIRPKLNSFKGVSLACGMAPAIADPYAMSIASIDEAIRNSICVGADLNQLAILDNFCWPSVADDETMGTLVAACEACRDAALAFGIPFISGKDSLHNQFTNSETGEVLRIPRTLLISAIGVIEDVRKCVTMDLKSPRSLMVLVTPPQDADLKQLLAVHRAVAKCIAAGHVSSAHDISDGGLLVAAAEMCIASNYGMTFSITSPATLLAEGNARYLLEIPPDQSREAFEILSSVSTAAVVADVTQESQFTIPSPSFGENAVDLPVEKLRKAWLGTLDW